MKRRLQLWIIASLLGAVNLSSQNFLAHRNPTLLENWKFQKREVHAAESVRFPSEDGWTDVSVPHTWNAKDILTEGERYYQGIAWYRTSFTLPRSERPQRTFIRFEGVSLVADVFLNGTYLGKHKGGYSAFCFEITPHVVYDRENILAVKVDNTTQPDVAPSGCYLYPLFGGIYRPVTLFRTAELCISPLDHASSGVTVRPLRVSDAEAEIDVESLLSYRSEKETGSAKPPGDAAGKVQAYVATSLMSRDGKTVASDRKPVLVTGGTEISAAQHLRLDRPHLWNGKTDPYLYTLHVRLEDAKGETLDEVDQAIGLRFYRVDRDSGLVLNGRAYPLYGVSRHQEWQGLGPALSDRHHEQDVEFIRELGATGVRLAHYQQAETMYGLCDEKGLVVWAEIPNTPIYRRHPDYLRNCQQQLTELIKQNINHPSILFWGLYNEIDIPTTDLKTLHDTARRLDPYRLTTQADYTGPKERHLVTDVAAWNWYYGWYYGEWSQYLPWFDNARREHPTLLAGLSEYGAAGCISQQQEDPPRPDPDKGRFFPEQYQRLYHENVWARIKDRKDIWCKFIWNLADFSWSTVRRGDRDFINHKGLITHDRQVKKDAFYFYKANWSDEPVLYVLSRRNTERTSSPVPVEVYTNLEDVDLTVNGIPVSRKKMESPIHKIRWDNVSLIPGPNRIEVTARRGDTTFTDTCEWILHEKQ